MTIDWPTVGTHRTEGGIRGVSKGVVIAVVAVVLVIVGIGSWIWFNGQSASENRAAAGQCVEGDLNLPVTVDPDIAAPVRAAADHYNAGSPIVGDHCVKVNVTSQPTTAMVAGLTAPNWNAALGPQPALWIPSSSRAVEQMRVPGLVQGAPASLASSPIVVAVPDQLRKALEKSKLSWSDLPGLQRRPLSDLGLSGWDSLRMALPAGQESLAAAVAVGSAVSGSDPLTDEAAKSGQVVTAVSNLAAGAPSTATAAALDSIADTAHAASAPVHAIPVTEQQAKAHPGVSEYRPVGANVTDDFPVAQLMGSWVDRNQSLAAGTFSDYLRAPAQQKLFIDNGLQPPAPNPVPAPPKSVLTSVQSVLSHPVLGIQSTLVLDTSAAMATNDGSISRLNNSLMAVQSTLDTMPPDFGFGAWVYAHDLAGGKPYRIVAPTATLTSSHRSELSAALGHVALAGSTTDRTYATLEAAYHNAVSSYASGKTNSILLITGGPNDDSGASTDQLAAQISGDSSHKVRVDVIVVGGQGAQPLQELSKKTGGTYTKLASSDDMAFGTAVNHALTTP